MRNLVMIPLYKSPFFLRVYALFTALTFFVSVFPAYAAPVRSAAAIENPVKKLDAANASLPKEFGEIQEIYQVPGGSDTVILIQDAHAVPDAQRNIRKIIGQFKKQYGVNLVGAEGSASRIDAQIFRSFPDKEKLQKTFESYFEKGELTGVMASAIFDEIPGIYEGLEDWNLYQRGLVPYLASMKKENALLSELALLEKNLQAKKQAVYSEKLFKIDRAYQDFREDHSGLAQFLKVLAEIKRPEAGAGLSVFLREIETEGASSAQAEAEVKKAAENFPASDLPEFNQKYQGFKTSRISPVEFAAWMKEKNPEFQFSPQLARLIHNQKRMREIEGTRFFDEFESYFESVKEKLFRNETERMLDEEGGKLELLNRLARLQLSRDDWAEVCVSLRGGPARTGEGILGLPLKLESFQPHIAFYENAEKREQALLNNLISLMGREKTKNSIVVAGGFHTEGLTQRLKDKKISYLLVTPGIDNLPRENYYQRQMKGDVSWKEYFKEEAGQISFYNAFVRGARGKLLDENSGAKKWRDQIIRDLADQGKIETAHDYTRFIDEVYGRSPVFKQSLKRIDDFLAGLRILNAENQITGANLLKLIRPSTRPAEAVASLGVNDSIPAGDFLNTLAASELRADIPERPEVALSRSEQRQEPEKKPEGRQKWSEQTRALVLMPLMAIMAVGIAAIVISLIILLGDQQKPQVIAPGPQNNQAVIPDGGAPAPKPKDASEEFEQLSSEWQKANEAFAQKLRQDGFGKDPLKIIEELERIGEPLKKMEKLSGSRDFTIRPDVLQRVVPKMLETQKLSGDNHAFSLLGPLANQADGKLDAEILKKLPHAADDLYQDKNLGNIFSKSEGSLLVLEDLIKKKDTPFAQKDRAIQILKYAGRKGERRLTDLFKMKPALEEQARTNILGALYDIPSGLSILMEVLKNPEESREVRRMAAFYIGLHVRKKEPQKKAEVLKEFQKLLADRATPGNLEKELRDWITEWSGGPARSEVRSQPSEPNDLEKTKMGDFAKLGITIQRASVQNVIPGAKLIQNGTTDVVTIVSGPNAAGLYVIEKDGQRQTGSLDEISRDGIVLLNDNEATRAAILTQLDPWYGIPQGTWKFYISRRYIPVFVSIAGPEIIVYAEFKSGTVHKTWKIQRDGIAAEDGSIIRGFDNNKGSIWIGSSPEAHIRVTELQMGGKQVALSSRKGKLLISNMNFGKSEEIFDASRNLIDPPAGGAELKREKEDIVFGDEWEFMIDTAPILAARIGGRLRVLSPLLKEAVWFPIPDSGVMEITLGRKEQEGGNHVVLNDPRISRMHAVLRYDGQVSIKDLSNKNRTFKSSGGTRGELIPFSPDFTPLGPGRKIKVPVSGRSESRAQKPEPVYRNAQTWTAADSEYLRRALPGYDFILSDYKKGTVKVTIRVLGQPLYENTFSQADQDLQRLIEQLDRMILRYPIRSKTERYVDAFLGAMKGALGGLFATALLFKFQIQSPEAALAMIVGALIVGFLWGRFAYLNGNTNADAAGFRLDHEDTREYRAMEMLKGFIGARSEARTEAQEEDDNWTLNRRIQWLGNTIDTAIKNAKGNAQNAEGYKALKRKFNREILPLKDDLAGMLDYFRSQENASDFQREMRSAVALKLGVSEENVFFIDASNLLVWGIARKPRPKAIRGVHFELTRTKQGAGERIVFVRSGEEDFEVTVATVHELLHLRQNIRVFKPKMTLLRMSIIEGYQEILLWELVLSLAQEESSFGKKLRELIEDRYANPGGENQLFARVFSDDFGAAGTLEEKLLKMSNGFVSLASYPAEKAFVEFLINAVGREAVHEYWNGDDGPLKKAMGENAFGMLEEFFVQSEKTESFRVVDGGYGNFEKSFAFRFALTFILGKKLFAEDSKNLFKEWTARFWSATGTAVPPKAFRRFLSEDRFKKLAEWAAASASAFLQGQPFDDESLKALYQDFDLKSRAVASDDEGESDEEMAAQQFKTVEGTLGLIAEIQSDVISPERAEIIIMGGVLAAGTKDESVMANAKLLYEAVNRLPEGSPIMQDEDVNDAIDELDDALGARSEARTEKNEEKAGILNSYVTQLEKVLDHTVKNRAGQGQDHDDVLALKDQFVREMLPLKDDPAGMVEYFRSQATVSDFQKEARSAIARKLAVSEKNVFFIHPSKILVWALANELNPREAGGLHFTLSQAEGGGERAVFVRSDLDEFRMILLLIHELLHLSQDSATDVQKSFLFNSAMEGYQMIRQYEVLLELVTEDSPFGGKIKKLILDIYETGPEEALFRALFGRSLSVPGTMEEEVRKIAEKDPSYQEEKKLTEALIKAAGREAVHEYWKKRDSAALSKALGENVFEALTDFFAQAEETAKASKRPHGISRKAFIFQFAEDFILNQHSLTERQKSLFKDWSVKFWSVLEAAEKESESSVRLLAKTRGPEQVEWAVKSAGDYLSGKPFDEEGMKTKYLKLKQQSRFPLLEWGKDREVVEPDEDEKAVIEQFKTSKVTQSLIAEIQNVQTSAERAVRILKGAVLAWDTAESPEIRDRVKLFYEAASQLPDESPLKAKQEIDDLLFELFFLIEEPPAKSEIRSETAQLAEAVINRQGMNLKHAEKIAVVVRAELRRVGMGRFAETFRTAALEQINENADGLDPWTIEALRYLAAHWSGILKNESSQTFTVGVYLQDEDDELTVDGFMRALFEQGVPNGLKQIISSGPNAKAADAFKDKIKKADLKLTSVKNPNKISGFGNYVPVLRKDSGKLALNPDVVNIGVDAGGVSAESWNPVLGTGESGSQVVLALLLQRRVQKLKGLSPVDFKNIIQQLASQTFPGLKGDILKWQIEEAPEGGFRAAFDIDRSVLLDYVRQLAFQLKSRTEFSRAA